MNNLDKFFDAGHVLQDAIRSDRAEFALYVLTWFVLVTVGMYLIGKWANTPSSKKGRDQ